MTVRWGIIGAGDIARKQTARAIQEARNAELTAVMRRSIEGARAFAREFGAAKAYDSVETLLADSEINAVYVATPVYLHAEQTIAAAQAGKHVLVEKPMAMSTAECQAMIEACQQHGTQLMVCYYQRFNVRHQKARELVQQGAIGRVTMAQTRQAFLYPPEPGNWRQDPARGGGGAIMDVGVHCIDTLRFILGEVEAVTALVDTLVYDYAVEDTATLLLRFQNGAQGVVSVAFTVPEVDVDTLNFLELCGTGGRIWTSPLHSKDSDGLLRLLTPEGEERFIFQQSTHVALIEAFGRCIEDGEPVPVPGVEGLRGMAVVEAAYESARTGRTVFLEL
ncbi:MAG TPA: Gfo/Idh/MocA family oxidoreductase [Anaerolineae bacterium]|nr:Gfo/Idh/MocA family oxidoreductase [Anaerolineae bacterium]HIQ05757.1 Gfo/Idh/MocA family oxidoreductase [Anaerolineae bacterium]